MTKFVDDDGYPTHEALNKIANWEFGDSEGWFAFIKEIWYLQYWGWFEVEEIHEIFKRPIKRIYISTAGWGGNEAIIMAMQKNHVLWRWHWYSSQRGGHYVFEKTTDMLYKNNT